MQKLTDINKPLEIRTDELTPDMQLLANVCGMSTVRTLLQNLPGTMFYIPQISHFTKFMQRYVMENKDKHQKQIAMELGVSERLIQKLKNGY